VRGNESGYWLEIELYKRSRRVEGCLVRFASKQLIRIQRNVNARSLRIMHD